MTVASCSQDNTLQYGISAIGNISGSSFNSDSGTILDIEEYACAERLEDNDRAFIIYDVLNKSPHREWLSFWCHVNALKNSGHQSGDSRTQKTEMDIHGCIPIKLAL